MNRAASNLSPQGKYPIYNIGIHRYIIYVCANIVNCI